LPFAGLLESGLPESLPGAGSAPARAPAYRESVVVPVAAVGIDSAGMDQVDLVHPGFGPEQIPWKVPRLRLDRKRFFSWVLFSAPREGDASFGISFFDELSAPGFAVPLQGIVERTHRWFL